ncbi:MAG: ATP-binding protein [Cytophagales bacterium]|nr:ATP-binding protein [Cytophagales bacterium]
MNNSKYISVLFGIIVGVISLITAVLLGVVDTVKLLSAGIISTFSSTLLFAIITENLFDKKINQIYKSFERIRNKEFERVEGDNTLLRSINPLKGINEEIYNFANLKQLEIDELKRLEAFRRDFLQDVSHELKTPIFAAQGFVHTLLDNIDADEEIRKKFLGKAAKSLDYLDLLVKDLLTISQMETGDIKMKMEAFDIISLVKETVDQLDSISSTKNIKLKFDPQKNKSVIVIADYYRVFQVLKNLITNAIKYSNNNSTITISCEKRKKVTNIKVIDEGKGIPKNHRKRIFERFYRIDKSRSKERGGTGLGLAIVKHIIEGHKTKIKLKSKINKGSIFSFNLKLAPKSIKKRKSLKKVLKKIR